MTKIDFIIVGQGLAGSVLAYLLWKQGQKVLIFDNHTEGDSPSSSQIAAGVINPITGMRFVKSWRIDDFLPTAREFYKELENILGTQLWHERKLYRVLRNITEENNWLLRNSYPEYQPYCGQLSCTSQDIGAENTIHPFHSFAEIRNAAQVNLPLLVAKFNIFFDNKKMFVNTRFDAQKCKFGKNNIEYENITAHKIIFCEGAKGCQNDLFRQLPFNLDKGEALLVCIPNLKLNNILKNKMSIVPLHDTGSSSATTSKDLYWVGATNAWAFDNALPSEQNRELIINDLKTILNTPFEVINHLAAIRPTVKDRRPFLGMHQQFSNAGIFNGFGTKGASLVPYWAAHFVDFLLFEKPIDGDVDIQRFFTQSKKSSERQ